MTRNKPASPPAWTDISDPDGEVWQRTLLFPRKARPNLDRVMRAEGVECYSYVPPAQPTIYVAIFPTSDAMMAFRKLCEKHEIELPPLERINVWKF